MKEIEEILFSNIVPCLDLDQVTRSEFFEWKINKVLTKLVKYVQFLSYFFISSFKILF